MNQQQLQQHDDDMKKLLQIEDLAESLELSVQKGISLAILNIDVEDAFSESFDLLEKMSELSSEIADDMIKLMAITIIKDSVNEFEEKMKQVN